MTSPPIRSVPAASTIEARGTEHVPATERHGIARDIGMMWSGAVLNVQVLVYGALLVAFGLNAWQCLAAIVIGNLTWVITGLCSLAGPVAGTTTFAISRAPLGRHGNRPIAFFSWITQIGYEVIDLVLMVLATTALLELAGVEIPTGGEVGLVVALSVLQGMLPLFGHAMITKVLRMLILPFGLIFAVMAGLTADRGILVSAAPADWAVFLGGVALVASGSGLGWSPNAADYSRYLPANTSRRRLVTAVAIGGGLPQSLLMLLGVGVGFLTTSATDPISGLPGAFPVWFVVPYLLLLIVQLGALNAVNLYSSGVTLQAMGVRIGRWQAVALDGSICVVIASIVLFSGGVNAFLSNFLLFMIIWLAPWAGIFVVDFVLRRGRYDLASLEPGQGGSYRRTHGLHLPGVLAQVTGMGASALWINTSVFVGPLAAATGGMDLSVPAGLIAGSGAYLVLARTSVRAETDRLDATPVTIATCGYGPAGDEPPTRSEQSDTT